MCSQTKRFRYHSVIDDHCIRNEDVNGPTGVRMSGARYEQMKSSRKSNLHLFHDPDVSLGDKKKTAVAVVKNVLGVSHQHSFG